MQSIRHHLILPWETSASNIKCTGITIGDQQLGIFRRYLCLHNRHYWAFISKWLTSAERCGAAYFPIPLAIQCVEEDRVSFLISNFASHERLRHGRPARYQIVPRLHTSDHRQQILDDASSESLQEHLYGPFQNLAAVRGWYHREDPSNGWWSQMEHQPRIWNYPWGLC